MKATMGGKIATMAVAAALAGALGSGLAVPATALADEGADAQGVVTDDGAAAEGAWDATADEGSFGADAEGYAEDSGDATLMNYVEGGADANWWYRRVTPWQALEAAEDWFGVYDYDDWDFQVGRFRGTPAYRVVIDVDDWWGPYYDDNPYVAQVPWGRYGTTTRYVAFVNYLTGRVMAAYVDYA